MFCSSDWDWTSNLSRVRRATRRINYQSIIWQEAQPRGKPLLCLKYNICTLQKKKYEFPDGLPMEGPLSMLASKVFMSQLEMDIFNSFTNHRHIRFWASLCLGWLRSGRWATLRPTLCVPLSISFTLEVGGDKITFLDLQITLTEHNNV